VKSFIYLDRDKIYSLSSQLMSGVTEYILEEKDDVVQKKEEQKGPVGSGRIIAEIIEKTSSSVEKKFLHDYAYSLFEDRLVELEKLVEVSEAYSFEDFQGAVRHGQIVKVVGKAKIVDYQELVKSLKAMDTIMPALSVVTSNEERVALAEELYSLVGNKKSDAAARLKKLLDIKTYAQKEHESFFQKNFSYVMEYMFSDSLDVEVRLQDYKVTADLQRENLREPLGSIVRKYSRFTEVEFSVVGIVTQVGVVAPLPEVDEITADHTMREAASMTTAALASLETSFRGRTDKEVIIDPIAIYTELR